MPGIIRSYTPADRPAVRRIYGMDEFARPRLQQKYPRYGEYLADCQVSPVSLPPVFGQSSPLVFGKSLPVVFTQTLPPSRAAIS